MADGTHIEWTDATWNPVTGCSVISPGCTNCYAMRLAGTRLKHTPSRIGLTVESKAGPVWNGEVRLNDKALDQPLRWRRPRRIFVCAHGDLFHEAVPDEWIDRVFAVMALAPQHTFQVLTKRALRMREYLCREGRAEAIGWAEAKIAADNMRVAAVGYAGPVHERLPLPNVWLGVSVEDQQRADERIPELLATPAAKRFISAEPLLGPVDLRNIERLDGDKNALTGELWIPGCGSISSRTIPGPRLDWVIAGGESGPGARPMNPQWARALRDQCQAAGVAYFFKQWGEWSPMERHRQGLEAEVTRMAAAPIGKWDVETDTLRVGKRAGGRMLDGIEWSEFP
jgi:protein gp37